MSHKRSRNETKVSSIIGGHAPENADSYHRLSKLLVAMTVMENGIRPHQVDTEAIYQGYKLAFPQNTDKLNEWMLGEDEYREW